MSDDDVAVFIHNNGIKFYRGPNPEAEREAEIFKAITRAKPGPTAGKSEDLRLAFAKACAVEADFEHRPSAQEVPRRRPEGSRHYARDRREALAVVA